MTSQWKRLLVAAALAFGVSGCGFLLQSQYDECFRTFRNGSAELNSCLESVALKETLSFLAIAAIIAGGAVAASHHDHHSGGGAVSTSPTPH